jgi:hypothetical protein
MKIGGRDPSTLKTLARRLTGRRQRRKKPPRCWSASITSIRWTERAAPATGAAAGSTSTRTAGAIREFQAVLARDPIDPAQAHFNLARAYNQNHQPEQAKDELISSPGSGPRLPAGAKVIAGIERSGEESRTHL